MTKKISKFPFKHLTRVASWKKLKNTVPEDCCFVTILMYKFFSKTLIDGFYFNCTRSFHFRKSFTTSRVQQNIFPECVWNPWRWLHVSRFVSNSGHNWFTVCKTYQSPTGQFFLLERFYQTKFQPFGVDFNSVQIWNRSYLSNAAKSCFKLWREWFAQKSTRVLVWSIHKDKSNPDANYPWRLI